MNINYLEARKLFPKIPEEIFTLWLDERIETNGWPIERTFWKGALRSKPIPYWTELEWRKTSIKIDYSLLTVNSQKIIDGLFAANFEGEMNEYHEIVSELGSQKRFKKIGEYIKKNGKLPNPLIFIYENGKYEIIDGCHRLTLFLLLKSLNTFQEAWVGTLPDSDNNE